MRNNKWPLKCNLGFPGPAECGNLCIYDGMCGTIEKDKWTSSTTCDECGKDCKTRGPWFVDGPEQGGGAWGLWCYVCHQLFGSDKFGPALGQKFDSQTLEKIDG